MKQIRILTTLLLIVLLASCSQDALENRAGAVGKEVTGKIAFSTMPMSVVGVSTRSTSPSVVSDAAIKDLWVLQFSGGALLKSTYYANVTPTAQDTRLLANTGTSTSNIYFVANAGSVAFTTAPANETAFLAQTKTITTEADLFLNDGTTKYIPMMGSLLSVAVPLSGYSLNNTIGTVNLIRLLAQVDINYTVSTAAANTFTLEQVRVCNVANTLSYSVPETGNFPTTMSSSTVINLPYETVSSPTSGSLTYYLPDNRRGVGTNTTGSNEYLKTGVNYATYIEFCGHTKGTQGGEEVTIRVYPGVDNFNDYNLTGNTHYTLTCPIIGISPSDPRVHYKERSNCYMVKPSASVNIPLRHVNDSDLGTQLPNVQTGWTASVYWQTATGLVTLAQTPANGYFTVTAPSGTATGNAVVVVTDASSNVLWSWHIWVTDYDPSVSTNTTVNGSYTWMQRNLGATATADGVNTFTTCGGLMYQWGRKDPFPNGLSAGVIALNGFTMPAYTGLTTNAVDTYVKSVDASASPISYTNQLAYSVKYPMLFMLNWAGSNATAAAANTIVGGINSWSGEYGYYMNKSVYDPCPEGWRVPSGRTASTTWVSPWNYWTTTTPSFATTNSAAVSSYPAAGSRNTTGVLSSVGQTGSYWSASINSANSYFISFISNAVPTISNNSTRANAFNVRCVKTQ